MAAGVVVVESTMAAIGGEVEKEEREVEERGERKR